MHDAPRIIAVSQEVVAVNFSHFTMFPPISYVAWLGSHCGGTSGRPLKHHQGRHSALSSLPTTATATSCCIPGFILRAEGALADSAQRLTIRMIMLISFLIFSCNAFPLWPCLPSGNTVLRQLHRALHRQHSVNYDVNILLSITSLHLFPTFELDAQQPQMQ